MSNKYHFCPKCGQQLLTNANFCHSCGANLKLVDTETVYATEELSSEEKNQVVIEDIPFVRELADTAEFEEELPEEVEEDEEEDDNPLVTKILLWVIGVIIVVLFILGLIFVLRMLDIKLNIPFLNNNKTQVVETKPEEVKPAETANNTAAIDLNTAIETFVKNNGGDYSKITSMVISGKSIKINDTSSTASAEKEGTYDLEAISKLTKLENLEIANVANLKFPTTSFSNVKNLVIKNSTVDPNLQGLANITSLESLSILNTSLSSLNGISSASNLKKLVLDGNGLTDISAINALNIPDLQTTNNPVAGSSNTSTSSTSTKRKIKVLIDDLNVRKTPDASNSNNIIPGGVSKDSSYEILEEKQDTTLGLTWYRIGEDKWIAGKEGEWTKIHE